MIFLSRRGFLALAAALASAAALPAWTRLFLTAAAGLGEVPMTVPMEVAHGDLPGSSSPARRHEVFLPVVMAGDNHD